MVSGHVQLASCVLWLGCAYSLRPNKQSEDQGDWGLGTQKGGETFPYHLILPPPPPFWLNLWPPSSLFHPLFAASAAAAVAAVTVAAAVLAVDWMGEVELRSGYRSGPTPCQERGPVGWRGCETALLETVVFGTGYPTSVPCPM